MRKGLVLLLLVALLAPALAASSTLRVQGRQILGPDGKPVLLRGMGLGNWLLPEGYMWGFERAVSPRAIEDTVAELIGPDEANAFWREWRAEYVTRADLDLLARAGFDHVRVPILYRHLTPEEHPGVWLDEGFADLDRVVRQAKAAGLWVVLDLHGAPGGQTGDNIDDSRGRPWLLESEASQARTVEVWRRLAQRYRDEPTVVAYELLNEPIAHYDDFKSYNPRLEPLYKRLVAGIREVDPAKPIMLGGAQWNTEFGLFGKPFDPGLIYAFHRYWADPSPAGIQTYVAFGERVGAPLYMSESGENTDEWIARFRQTLEDAGIGWAFWPYKKLESASCVATVTPPPGWKAIVDYADNARGGTYEEKRKRRPTPAAARQALSTLLDNIRLERCRVNPGYLRALGMKPVP